MNQLSTTPAGERLAFEIEVDELDARKCSPEAHQELPSLSQNRHPDSRSPAPGAPRPATFGASATFGAWH